MHTVQIENWEDLKFKLKFNFRHLTENDLKYVKGQEDKLISRLGRRLGNRKEEIIDILNRINLG